MKDIILILLVLILIILIIIKHTIFLPEKFIDEKYNCPETLKLRDNYFETPEDISVCKDKITVNSYDDYSTVDISKIANQTDEIEAKYFKINYYNSRDQDNKIIKLASIKSYLGLPGYLPANIHDYSGDLKHFEKNYNIDIDDKLKNKIVSNAYNYVNNIDYN
jgi:hypothetical protein